MSARALAAVTLVAVAVAGCGGIDDFDEFRRQLTSRWCERQVRCGELGAAETDHCGIPAPLGSIGPGIDDLPGAISRKALQFHGGNAQHCLDAIQDAPCDPNQADLAFRRWCHNVVSALVPVGGACLDGLECQGGACDSPRAGCPGSCVAWANTGAACDGSGLPAKSCDPTVHYCAGGVCARKQPLGGRCNNDIECVFDTVCVDGRCGDHPRLREGDNCGAALPPCKDGLFCDSTLLCTKRRHAGDACTVADACDDGLTCVAGSCTRWSDLGKSCSGDGSDGAPTGCPASQRCAGGSCALAVNAEQRTGPDRICARDGDCQPGLWCQSSHCSYRAGAGGGCLADSACVDALGCDLTARQCVAPQCPAS